MLKVQVHIHRKTQILRKAIPLFLAALASAQTLPLPEAPQVRAKNHVTSLTLRAVNKNGKDAFAFDGALVAPVLRVSPGETLSIDYINDLPVKPTETCAVNPCMDMTNLHFHGLSVSPNAHQDDVLDMLAKPGESLHYAVEIPRGHLPGLFWYHTHPHGESHRQVLDGMSGAIIVEGMERYVPTVKGLRERVIVVRGQSIEHDKNGDALRRQVGIPDKNCGGTQEAPEEIMTANGAVRPQIQIAPNERQFWRIVNASADRYIDLQVDGQPFEIVALDGMPLAYHEPKHPTFLAEHFLVSPGGRLEAIVTGPPASSHGAFRTLCVDTGTAGDPNPGMVLADLVPGRSARKSDPSTERARMAALVPRSSQRGFDTFTSESRIVDKNTPAFNPIDPDKLMQTEPDFTVTFTEDKNGFYINGSKFVADAQPMTAARVGTYQHWRIVNATAELHPFHIHQVHFLAYAENGVALTHPVWLDTVNVPYGGSVDVLLDFTNPVIKGMSLFHCHLLNHEDKGMMAKILFK